MLSKVRGYIRELEQEVGADDVEGDMKQVDASDAANQILVKYATERANIANCLRDGALKGGRRGSGNLVQGAVEFYQGQ
jgi:hypothetical protein